MVCASEGNSQPTSRKTMTASFITETVDQELQLTELQNINGGTLPLWLAWGLGAATGAMGKHIYDHRECLADTLHDLISAEDDGGDNKGANSTSSR